MTVGYQTTGSPPEPRAEDQAAWDRASDAVFRWQQATGKCLTAQEEEDATLAAAQDHEHPAWDAYYAAQRNKRAPNLHPIFRQALAPFMPNDDAA